MKKQSVIFGCISAAILSLSASVAMAGSENTYYEVTITNLTRSESFTPILVASHKKGVSLFELGSAASNELAMLAEGGDVAPLTDMLKANRKVVATSTSDGLLVPGGTTVIKVSARGADYISLASMLIPTNDGFFALNGVRLSGKSSTTFYSPAYDAGTEMNDEACINIPGPVCGGEGYSPEADGEGYVHIHSGIHGIGDLSAATYDWRNPVAKITIRKVGEE
jgi:hypothetical protein